MADPATISVPDLVGQTQSEAEATLKRAGLALGNVTKLSSPTRPIGSVSGTDPVAGASVTPGSAVNLQVSSGPPQVAAPTVVGSAQPAAPVAVPKMVGLTRSAAVERLKNAGLVVGAVKTH
jgi:beta-lactam-binding protein with PASTA domain